LSEKIVLSLMSGLFQGGSPIIHSDIIGALHQQGRQRHAALSLTSQVSREHTVQRIEDSVPHGILTRARLGLHWLNRQPDDEYSPMDLVYTELLMRGADVLFSLKEQPLSLLRDIGPVDRPLVVALHRSDPENQGSGLDALTGFAKDGTLSAAVCCAHSVQRAYHEATGIPVELLPVIPNGVDTDRFAPSEHRRERVRDALGIGPDAPVVFLSARFDGMKNIPLFVATAGRFLQAHPEANFIMCGAGMTYENGDLQNMLDRHIPEELHSRFKRLGIRTRMEALYAAADIAVLTSKFGEAAPLSLMEAMSCGVIPVTTDVGDSALIAGDERLVGGDDPDDLAERWSFAYTHREELRPAVLARREEFDSRLCHRRYGDLLDAV
jgi:glycosyltransferase involved in cell wall biosynthesis